ncbi:uncharacterized protein Z518_03226 [Rhinocladiella mackenziei CBS 650.93]|uniref:Rhinocladiella mackenziei CBS 650.93 unplaced genomic scaffold supercont1.2, whole genome shotgun sequence n=1 Tax=Rhinocladiella mackenziei CBS 650.93 TaxID=1442369 RepID=A0A0D2JGW6_9EURO|nr:uncharacterized protein Z518_03226 [Rhinocladiella mackenziei CBS 650.93]KIX08570.1 hypothetical protein Z518_03226 [Rhinocladiella mackenziei CBS 650.93]
MMIPRSFAQNPLMQRQHIDFNEKDHLSKRKPNGISSPSPPRSALSQRLSQQTGDSGYKPHSDPVKIPPPTEKRSLTPSRRSEPSSRQIPRSVPTPQAQDIPKRKESVQDILSSTTIPIRRKQKPRPSQRLPKCDYVADFSKLLRDDVQPSGDGSLSGSWTNPQFEGLFGNIDGLVEGQMIVGSEGVDAGMLSTRSISSESMPSLASPDDDSATDVASVSPATIRSPSDHRLRQMASSEDCSNQHPLLALDEDDDYSGTSTPELAMSPPSRLKRKPVLAEKRQSSFKSSLTASLKALKSAAQTMSNIASTPPLVQSDDFLTKSIFDFQPALTDDRRPPPSDEPPSAALRRYLNPHSMVPSDSPAQLHFWVDEKPSPPSSSEIRPKLKIKKKYQNQNLPSSPDDQIRFKRPKSTASQLPPIVPLATCIPSSIRTAHASSPPTWLEPDGTPSNKHRAAQALWEGAEDGTNGEGQPRTREPRENRDFLRVFVCEMNMRKKGKLSDEAVGHARLWLPPVDEGEKDKDKMEGPKAPRKTGLDRWASWSSEDL